MRQSTAPNAASVLLASPYAHEEDEIIDTPITPGDHKYLFDNSAHQAGDRFGALGALFDPVTIRHVENLGIGLGWRCWEVGAGGGSIVRWLSDRTGTTGSVVATDLDVRWLQQQPSTANVHVLQHDVVNDAPPPGPFDLVHERLVLVHVQDRAAAIERMVSVLRPGGWLLLEDFDSGAGDGGFVDAESDLADLGASIVRGMRQLLTERGADPALGSKLPGLLRQAGLAGVEADAYQVIERGDAVADLLRANVDQVAGQLIERRMVTDRDLDRYRERLSSGALRPTSPTLVSAWAKRP